MGVLLVSSTKIKQFTALHEGVDDALLLAGIQVSQDIGLQTLLGGLMYSNLLTNVQNNTLNSTDNLLLQDYIQPYLLHRALWQILPNVYMRQMNKSIIVGTTEQGSAVDKSSFVYLRNTIQDTYEFYAQRLMDRIRAFPGDYPDYYSYSIQDGMKPNKVNYFGGVHIPNGARYIPPAGIKGWADPTGDYCCNDDY